jgi:hypothetical protein
MTRELQVRAASNYAHHKTACIQEPLAILLSGGRTYLHGPGVDGDKRASGPALLEEEILAAQGFHVVRVDISGASALPHDAFLSLFVGVLKAGGVEVSQELKDASGVRVKEIKEKSRPGRLVGPDGERLLGAVELHRRYQEGVGVPAYEEDEDEWDDEEGVEGVEGEYDDEEYDSDDWEEEGEEEEDEGGHSARGQQKAGMRRGDSLLEDSGRRQRGPRERDRDSSARAQDKVDLRGPGSRSRQHARKERSSEGSQGAWGFTRDWGRLASAEQGGTADAWDRGAANTVLESLPTNLVADDRGASAAVDRSGDGGEAMASANGVVEAQDLREGGVVELKPVAQVRRKRPPRMQGRPGQVIALPDGLKVVKDKQQAR